MAEASDLERRRRFEDFVEAVYVPRQRYVGRRIHVSSAEDVLGDVLLVLWRRCDDIPADGTLAWSYAVARRCLANHRRGTQRRSRLLTRLAELPVSTGPECPDPRLLEALHSLSEGDRELLRLWAWEQLPPREIAVVLDISPNAASIRLHRARGRLRDHLAAGKDRAGGGHLPGQEGTEASR
ncbi:MAG: sigma-70 family RNA polymerase sigma factor [Geodermatophilaceae bacterium]